MLGLIFQMFVRLLMVVGVVNTAVITNDKQCFLKVNGSSCTTHIDCRCPQTYMLCNREQHCEKASVALITNLVPCPPIYKKACSYDGDCKCSEEKLTCEQNECVRFKKKTVKLHNSSFHVKPTKN